MTKQTRWIVIAVAAVALGIFFFIVAKWLLLVLIAGLVVGGIVFATEAAKESAPVRPPAPVYHPPAQQPAPYSQGYQAQSPQKSEVPGFPFGPNNAEPQPHEARPDEGQQYEEPLVMYPEAQS